MMRSVSVVEYSWAASNTSRVVPEGMWTVLGVAFPINLLTSLMLPNVPLAITASFPLLEPKLLKSLGLSPLLARYLAAGEFLGMEPAGEMWSVVTESPRLRRTWADLMGRLVGSSGVIPAKNGGCLM